MNKLFLTTVSVGTFCIFSVGAFAENVSSAQQTPTAPEASQSSDLSKSVSDLINKFQSKTNEFLDKAKVAADEGQKDLSTKYKKLSDSSNEIVIGLKEGKQDMVDSGTAAYNAVMKDIDGKTQTVVTKTKSYYDSLTSKTTAWKNRGKYYYSKSEEAAKEGNKNLAELYKACSDSAYKVSDSIKSIVYGRDMSLNVKGTEKDNSKLTVEQYDMLKNSKAVTPEEKADVLNKCSVISAQEAVNAEKAGNSNLAFNYRKLSEAQKKASEGFKSLGESQKEFSSAKENLSEYMNENNSVQTKN